MRKTLMALVVALLLPYGAANAGSMLEGGIWGQISFAGNVTINPSFGYYPAVRGEVGVDRFLFAVSLGGVFAGEVPEQVVGVDGAFKLRGFPVGTGNIFVYVMGGVSSQQGSYAILVDASQYKVGPKIYWAFDSQSKTWNGTSLWFSVPFMTSQVEDGTTFDLQNVKYIAVEGGVTFEI